MASSIEGLRQEIMAEMRAAMEDAKEGMFNDLQSEVIGYYTGKPVQYHRTYQLLTAPRADPVTGGDTITTRIYLNGAGGYTTGCYPSMARVISWTDNGGAGTIGHHGYWSRSLKSMKHSFISAFNSHFS